MRDDRLPKIILVDQLSWAKQKADHLQWDGKIPKERFKGSVTSWESVKREALNRLGRKRSVRSCVGFI